MYFLRFCEENQSRHFRGGQNPHKNPKIGIFKLQPKIVVMLVLGTPEHIDLGLKLQNWPFAVYFNFCRFKLKNGQ